MNDAKKTVEQILKIADIKINGSRPFDIQVHDDRLYQRVLSKGELGAGEAYMDGWWSAKQLDTFINRLMASNARSKIPVTPALIKTFLKSSVANRQKIVRSYKNASAHYDVGNDLYSLMLDKQMVYSCGFWQDAKNLDEAQTAKLDRICKKLKLKKGMTLLDIGCGWGGFSAYAAKNYGVKVTGISPAIEQVKLARERTKGLSVTIQQKDYREVGGKYDRIVSIGMLEHVGPKNYKEFFSKCNDMLNSGGMMLHHTIGGLRSVKFTDPWIEKYIFPGGVLPSLAQITRATEKILIVEDVENFGPDYDKTLMEWYKNFVKSYPKLKDKYDERFFRMWEYYLLTCTGAFRSRKLQLWQVVISKAEPSPAYRGYR
jgi:cyclopropane-fatty-acyl-phospholipid synthase